MIDVLSLLEKITPSLDITDTAYGEPQGWLYLDNGESVEVTYESYGIPRSACYFSIRRHCSDEDFVADRYHETMGVIDSLVVSANALQSVIAQTIGRLKALGIHVVAA